MQNKWLWIFVAGVLALIGGVLWWLVGPVAVSVVTPTHGPAVEAIYATGTVEPSVMLPIAPRQGGNLVELNVDEGGQVRKGQVLARFDDADLDNTVEELAARARYAQAQYRRNRELARRGFQAKLELDRVRAEMEAAEAALKRAGAQRGFLLLTAPADGSIIRRDGEVGQFIPAGQAVFYLSCCAPLRVTAEVDEEDIPRVRVGQKAVLRADALPGQVLDGEVGEVTPKGDPVARSYRVRIRLADPAGLRVGMTVDANLVVAERQNALLVPSSAVRNGAVWIVANGRLRRQPVRIGVAGAERTEILEGLAPDAQVVDAPAEDLREGRAARIRPPSPANTAELRPLPSPAGPQGQFRSAKLLLPPKEGWNEGIKRQKALFAPLPINTVGLSFALTFSVPSPNGGRLGWGRSKSAAATLLNSPPPVTPSPSALRRGGRDPTADNSVNSTILPFPAS